MTQVKTRINCGMLCVTQTATSTLLKKGLAISKSSLYEHNWRFPIPICFGKSK
jgi:hypothetical protein